MKEEKTKVALVTGGNRGIGAGIVEVFAEKGYDIFLAHYGEKEKADAVADIEVYQKESCHPRCR